MVLNSRKAGFFVGAVLLSSTAAVAQTAPAPAAEENIASTDIVVTAQRRAERLQEVPLAVTAMTSDDIKLRQINNTLDLVNYVPNLIGHNNTALGTANTYSLRGLANTESISTFDPPVGPTGDGRMAHWSATQCYDASGRPYIVGGSERIEGYY